jgi:cell division protease FtsH
MPLGGFYRVQKRGKDKSRSWWTALAVSLLFLCGIYFLYRSLAKQTTLAPLSYGEMVEVLTAGRKSGNVALANVKVSHGDIRGEIVTTDLVSDGHETKSQTQTVPFRTLRTGFERDQGIYALLQEAAGPAYQGAEEDSVLRTIGNSLLTLLMFLILGAGLILAVRWMSGAGSPLTFGRSRAKLYAQKDLAITFADVAGIDEAVAELREVVDFLSTPDKYQALGGRIPKGVLLVGPPGTGKTLLAKAVAGEAGAPFFSLSGSDFVEMFVGVGAARVRDLFAQAESKAPCIIFIDELDALGKTRSGTTVGGHDEREQTLNQLLVEMDGFESNRGVIIMAATNRPETLDPALLRPGRFDRTVVVDRPDISGREAILKVHVRHVRLATDVDLRRIASLTPGTAGADLANLVNEAALMAARAGKEEVTMAEFEEAVERSAVGLERKSRIMTADEKQRVAFHEAGHALVSCSLPNTHPVHKISIIPRGIGALGYVLSRPDEDRYLVTQSELESKIKVALGGTVAEEMVFREISNGATSDLEEASRIARSMVKEFGMSSMGRVSYQDGRGSFLTGLAPTGLDREYSEETAREIDVEVHKILDAATVAVRQVLLARRDALESIAQRLMEKEVIAGAELRDLLEPGAGPDVLPLPTHVVSEGCNGHPGPSLS